MSFLIYFLIFFIFPYFSTSHEYVYGIIHNASIELPFPIPADGGHQLTFNDCDECLCNAFGNSEVDLFTCTRNTSNKFICQFYYFMPTRDEIKNASDDTNIYVMKENATFGEKDDCCNTTFLIDTLMKTPVESNFTEEKLRFLALNEKNNTIITNIAGPTNTYGKLLIFDRSTLNLVNESHIPSITTVGYNDSTYYLGKPTGRIEVYDETLNFVYYFNVVNNDLTTIRFLNENQMLVGTSKKGAYICKRDNTKRFGDCTQISETYMPGQVHGFGVVNESAFYVGWAEDIGQLHLYTKDSSGSWSKNNGDNVTFNGKTSDIVIDRKCPRIWIVKEGSNEILIYDKTLSAIKTIQVDTNSASLFNLIILENYTLVISHGGNKGLLRIKPSLNCCPPP